MRHTDILFFTLIDTVLHSVAYVRSWKAPKEAGSLLQFTHIGSLNS